MIAETVSEIDPASERYQAGIRDDIRKARRSIVVTEFTSSIPGPHLQNRSWHRSRQDLRGSRIYPQGALSWPEISRILHVTRELFVNVLSDD